MSHRPKNWVERFLTLFTEVEPGEGTNAILLFFNLFLLLTAYYIMKPVREALILAEGGAELKSYSSAGQVLLLLGVVPLYSYLSTKFARKKLINVVTLFFTFCLGLFFVLAHLHVPLGIIFFLWVGIFSLMVIAQFWSFANDLYTPEAGKRLFVIIAFGASSGAVSGSFIAGQLAKPVGVYNLLLVAGALLLVSLLLTNQVDARMKKSGVKTSVAKVAETPLPKGGAFRLVLRQRYLLYIALMLLFLNWVNTTGEYILGRTVTEAARQAVATPEVQAEAMKFAENPATGENLPTLNPAEKRQSRIDEFNENWEKNYIGKFYADFYTIVNLVGLLLQLFVVSRIFKYFGIRAAILILPVIALFGYLVVAFLPLIGIVRWTKTAENATDYSLQNTVRHVLFLPTSREEKYKAKQAIDTFFVRTGDVLSAALVYVGTTWLTFTTKQFALFNLGLVAVWLFLALVIGYENHRLVREKVISEPMQ